MFIGFLLIETAFILLLNPGFMASSEVGFKRGTNDLSFPDLRVRIFSPEEHVISDEGQDGEEDEIPLK